MKILVKIKDNKLHFLNKKKLNSEYKNMLNTNVISNDELVFSDEYIYKNTKIIASFFNELIKNYQINTLSFQNMDVSLLILPFANRLHNIDNIIFESDEVLTYKICEIIIKILDVKNVSAYNIPQYMFELLDKYGIIPESRSEILFTSNFMAINELTNYSSLFYKYSVFIDFPLDNNDLEDFTTFCKINRHLKIININMPNKINLEEIIYILREYRHKNIKILINGDIQDKELIDFLRKNHKLIKNKYKIILKLTYSDKFIEENIIKETNNSILRSCALLIIGIVFMAIGFI